MAVVHTYDGESPADPQITDYTLEVWAVQAPGGYVFTINVLAWLRASDLADHLSLVAPVRRYITSLAFTCPRAALDEKVADIISYIDINFFEYDRELMRGYNR